MGADYIPEKDVDAEQWLSCFAHRVAQEPEAFRVAQSDVDDALAAALAFREALKATQTPGTTCTPLIHAKNQARKRAEAVIRPIAQAIRRSPHVPEFLKVQVGMPSPAKRRRSVAPPDSAPALDVVIDWRGIVTIHVWDSVTKMRRRPKDVVGLELYQRVVPRAVVESRGLRIAPAEESETPVVDPSGKPKAGWRFMGLHTAWPIVYPLTGTQCGDELTFIARWVTRQGTPGPFGDLRIMWASRYTPAMAKCPARHDRMYPAA